MKDEKFSIDVSIKRWLRSNYVMSKLYHLGIDGVKTLYKTNKIEMVH
jgi:hypothetical protein